ncbi:MAG: caspase family protein [Flavobacteriales bacterium]|nr:caspase family protein [Flavobacteriales bacterium]
MGGNWIKAAMMLCLSLISFYVDASCISGNCINGTGTFVYGDNSRYSGTFRAGKPHGSGVFIGVDGSKYTGQFVKGFKHGLGKWVSISGDIYTGNFAYDVFDGKGRMAYANGDIYVGEWKEGYAEGYGIYTFKNGSKYEGSFDVGRFSGQGRFTDTQGNYYEGPWVDNEKHGLGVSYSNGKMMSVEYVNNTLRSQKNIEASESNHHYATGVKQPTAEQSAAKRESLSGNKATNQVSEKVSKSMALPKIFALIIGIASYQHMPSLKYTDDDAYLLYAFLKSPEGGALPDDQISILVDEAATREAIISGLNDLGRNAGKEDVILVFMAGHGLKGGFAPGDYNGYNNPIAYSDILNTLTGFKARHKLLITDACHSGSMTTQLRGSYDTALDSYYSAIQSANGGTAVMMSSASEEVSMEFNGLRQGVFSHFIIRGLKGAADKNGDRLVTISELYAYVQEGVRNYTARSQNPMIKGDYDKNMPLAWVNMKD